jgi:hypothetical protein
VATSFCCLFFWLIGGSFTYWGASRGRYKSVLVLLEAIELVCHSFCYSLLCKCVDWKRYCILKNETLTCIFMPKRCACGCDNMGLIQHREEYSSMCEFVRAAVLIWAVTTRLAWLSSTTTPCSQSGYRSGQMNESVVVGWLIQLIYRISVALLLTTVCFRGVTYWRIVSMYVPTYV